MTFGMSLSLFISMSVSPSIILRGTIIIIIIIITCMNGIQAFDFTLTEMPCVCECGRVYRNRKKKKKNEIKTRIKDSEIRRSKR